MRQIVIDKDDRVVPPSRPRKSKRKKGFFAGLLSKSRKKNTAGRKAEPQLMAGGAAALSRLGGLSIEITDRITTPFRGSKPKRGGRRKPAPAWRKPVL